MLDEDVKVSLPTEEDLPYSDGKPVDSELQLLAGFQIGRASCRERVLNLV